MIRHKTIAQFPFDENLHEFMIEKPGMYSVNIIGAGTAENKGSFKISVKPLNGSASLPITIPLMQFRSATLSGISLEYQYFTAETSVLIFCSAIILFIF